MAKSRAAVRRPAGVLGDAALLKRLADVLGFTPLPAGREALSALTVRLPSRFPPLYEQLVIAYRWPEPADLGPFALLSNPPGPDLAGLAAGIFRDPALTDPLLAAAQLPFALAGNGDPVCFDTTRRHPDRDAPIVQIAQIVRIDPAEIRAGSKVQAVAEIAPSFRQIVDELLERAEG
jgi:hypothetical protein